MINLAKLINEWKLPEPLSNKERKRKIFLNKIFNSPLLNLKIGKWDVDKGQKGFEYSWNDAIDKKLISKATADRVMKICNKLGIVPEKVYFGWYVSEGKYEDPITRTTKKYLYSNLKSTYVLAYYKDEPIIFAQRQTLDPIAGQFYVFSKHKKSGKVARIGKDNSNIFMEDPAVTKEQILDFLQIKDKNIDTSSDIKTEWKIKPVITFWDTSNDGYSSLTIEYSDRTSELFKPGNKEADFYKEKGYNIALYYNKNATKVAKTKILEDGLFWTVLDVLSVNNVSSIKEANKPERKEEVKGLANLEQLFDMNKREGRINKKMENIIANVIKNVKANDNKATKNELIVLNKFKQGSYSKK